MRPLLSWSTLFDRSERFLPWLFLFSLIVSGVFPVSTTVTALIILLNLITSSWTIGARLVPRAPRFAHLVIGVISLCAAQSLAQTAWYYAGGLLGTTSDALCLALPLLLFQIWELRAVPPTLPLSQKPTVPGFLQQARWTVPILLLSELLLGCIAVFVKSVATDRALNSPWPLLPAGIFAIIFLLVVLCWIASVRTKTPLVTALVGSTLFWSVALITPILYILGFGFDGFLHRASEQLILVSGTLTPKPPYYLGQYVFVTWFSRLSGLTIGSIDRWLVPGIAGLLPLSVLALPGKEEERRFPWLALIALFPLGILVTTTPQSFAYLLGIAAVFLALGLTERRVHPVAPLLLAGWSVVTHPLAGLPLALIVTGLCWIQLSVQLRLRPWLSRTGSVFFALLVGAIVPLAFVVNSVTSANHIDWHLERLLQSNTWNTILQHIFHVPITHLALWPDWADTVTWLVPFLLIGGALIALWKRREDLATSILLLGSSVTLFFAGIVLSQAGEFAFLIDYERGNYAERLFLLATLAILPLSLLGWAAIWKRIHQTSPFVITGWVTFFGALVAGQVYNALPRHDAGVIGHGWSVSTADVEAVKFIDRDAQNEPYTVLANQSVSAAAVANLGFKRYYGDVFFYPIPTGGPLYQFFLDATNIPSRDPIEAAAVLGNSQRVYLVLNKYWWNASQVQETFRGLADKTWSVRNGEDYIFRFNVSTSTKL